MSKVRRLCMTTAKQGTGRRPDVYEIDYSIFANGDEFGMAGAGEDGFEAMMAAFDVRTRFRVLAHIQRLRTPDYHDLKIRNDDLKDAYGKAAKAVGLYEFSIDFGPGYRVYFGYRDASLVLAKVASKPRKRRQNKDIEHASKLLGQWDAVRTRRERPRHDTCGGGQR